MASPKIYALIALPIGIVLLFWLFTSAFGLVSAPSDLSVIFGVLLCCVGLFLLFGLIRYVLKNLFQ